MAALQLGMVVLAALVRIGSAFSQEAALKHQTKPLNSFCWFGPDALSLSGAIPGVRDGNHANSFLEHFRHTFPFEHKRFQNETIQTDEYFLPKHRRAFGGRLPVVTLPGASLSSRLQVSRPSVQHGNIAVVQSSSWLHLPDAKINRRVAVLYDGKFFSNFKKKLKAPKGPYRDAVYRMMGQVAGDSRCLSWVPVSAQLHEGRLTFRGFKNQKSNMRTARLLTSTWRMCDC